MPDWIQYEARQGAPIQAGGRTLTPVARSLRISLPGKAVGLIWNRPVAVNVQAAGEADRMIPIVDVTRIAQLWIVGAFFLFAFILGTIVRARR
jgi:hypothetical protein